MKLYSLILPYLLLVTFSGPINEFKIDKIKAINESPYQGVTVALIDGYNPGIYSEKDFQDGVKLIKANCKKHVWPWVFFNRFIGYKEGTNNKHGNKEYFRKIKGMDLFDDAGALGDFYHLWRLSLKIAKELGSPGIFVDPESYNNYSNYQLSYLAGQLGRTPEETKNRLRAVGNEMVRIAGEEYPEAILWFTFTGIASPLQLSKNFWTKELMTPAFIVQGMLEKARETGAKVKIVSGGMVSVGYCHESYEDLRRTIETRQQQFAPFLATYPNLALAGTIAPWADAAKKRNWTLRSKCGKATMQNLEDFKPLMGELLKTYDYVWIYAASAAGYDPYDVKINPVYNEAINDILKNTGQAK